MDKFLKLEHRHTGEILRMRRVRDGQGQIILALDGSLPPGSSGPPLHLHFHEHEEIIVKAGNTRRSNRDGECRRASRRNCSLTHWSSPSMVECG